MWCFVVVETTPFLLNKSVESSVAYFARSKFGVGIEANEQSNSKCKDEILGFFPIR